MGWENKSEDSAPSRIAISRNRAFMVFHDLMNNEQAKTYAFPLGFCCEEWFKYIMNVFLIDPFTVIYDFADNHIT